MMALTEIAVIQTVPAAIEIKNIYLNRFFSSKRFTSGLSIAASQNTLFSFYILNLYPICYDTLRDIYYHVVLQRISIMSQFLFQPGSKLWHKVQTNQDIHPSKSYKNS